MLNKAFSLIELLTIVAIVAIIAAFAVPSYISYVIQTKVNSLWAEAEPAKLAVQSAYMRTRQPIDELVFYYNQHPFTSSSTNFVKCVTIQNGTISVVGKPEFFYGKDIWLTWVPTIVDGAIDWTCIYSSDAAEYMQGMSETCSAYNCSEYGDWSDPTEVGGTQDVWYFGILSSTDIATAFANNCRTSATMAGCSECYNYVGNDTTRRFMSFDAETQVHNYSGALGDSGWSSYSSWTYDYTYTVAHQTCMEQTRTKTDCDDGAPQYFLDDGSCS